MPISGGAGRGTRFAFYTYNVTLGAGVTFQPPANTIITIATLVAAADLEFMNGGLIIDITTVGERGLYGQQNCDGTTIGYRNNDPAGSNFGLRGMTFG